LYAESKEDNDDDDDDDDVTWLSIAVTMLGLLTAEAVLHQIELIEWLDAWAGH